MPMHYTKNFTTFDEWVCLVLKMDGTVSPFCRIPYYEWLDEYIESIHNRTIKEVKDLLRCLLRPFTRKLDFMDYEQLKRDEESENTLLAERARYRLSNIELCKRIENGQEAWEGLTWVLEFLPNHPYRAIKTLENYLIAESINLPDDRITGIEQCMEIIMGKFINYENPLNELTKLKPVEFEWLIEDLYQEMGYKTTWTPSTRDGGKDIIATKERPDGNEVVYVECKLYKTTKLKIESVRSLGYVISKNNVNRGVIYCTGYANDNIKKFDNRIQICSYDVINILLNAHIGSNWVDKLDNIINFKREEYKKS